MQWSHARAAFSLCTHSLEVLVGSRALIRRITRSTIAVDWAAQGIRAIVPTVALQIAHEASVRSYHPHLSPPNEGVICQNSHLRSGEGPQNVRPTLNTLQAIILETFPEGNLHS